MTSQLNELWQQYAGNGPNQILLANAILLVLSDLNKKPVPEAYMAYALYDRDSNQYDSEDGALRKALVKLFSSGPGCRADFQKSP
ncbi:MAG: hypothetical protein ACXIUD_08475 [Mongoliitalea sp.]